MKFLLPSLILLILLLIIRNGIVSILNSFSNETTGVKLEQTLAEEEKKNKFLKERLYYVKTNQFVEEEAKEKLGMLRSGELFVIAPTSTPLNQEKIVLDDKPNWKKWLDLFF